tara:strand:- start:12014 stop:13747 length:1734 start_codon:yes stop_codon:yes gene_type:complete
MRHFRIPAFTGVEAHRDDADRGTLRLAEGCVPAGPGGLRSAPVFVEMGDGSSNSSSTANNNLAKLSDSSGNTVVMASRNNEIHDVRVFAVANTQISTLGTPTLLQQSTMVAGPACLSSVGNNTLAWGDGSADAEFMTQAGDAGDAPDDTIYHQEYAGFPNCKFFIVGPQKTLYGAGDPSNPLTIYISEPANMTVNVRDSLYSSAAISTVVLLMTDATEITALSAQGNHVVVHTDAGAHVLRAPAPGQASTGYRVEQAPLTAASAAVNQQVVAGEIGSFPYWFGFDGQIYKDESARRGAEEKPAYTDPDQVSWKAKGRWEKELPVDLSDSFATYNAELGVYWVFARSTEHTAWLAAGSPATWGTPTKYKGYIYSELTNSLAGPFVGGALTAITSISNTSEVLGVDENKKVKVANLDHFRDYDFIAAADPWPDTTTQPSKYVAATEAGAFLYRGRYLTEPFGAPSEGTTTLTDPMYFGDASLAIAETAWLNLDNEHEEKQVHSIHLNFSKNSVGRLWVFAESDEGLVSGQYKGAITDKVKVFTNLRGRRIRIRMFVVTHDNHPWNLREMAIGYLQGSAV